MRLSAGLLCIFATLVAAPGAAQAVEGAAPPLAEPEASKPSIAPPAGKPGAPATVPATAATVVTPATVGAVMGRKVRSRDGAEDLGRIVDVLVDGSGAARAAVIDFGGFLGMGSRKVAVAWTTLDFTHAGETGSVEVTLMRDQIRQSPEYKADEPVVILEGSAPPRIETAKPDPARSDSTGSGLTKPEPVKPELAKPLPTTAAKAPPGDHNRDAPAR